MLKKYIFKGCGFVFPLQQHLQTLQLTALYSVFRFHSHIVFLKTSLIQSDDSFFRFIEKCKRTLNSNMHWHFISLLYAQCLVFNMHVSRAVQHALGWQGCFCNQTSVFPKARPGRVSAVWLFKVLASTLNTVLRRSTGLLTNITAWKHCIDIESLFYVCLGYFGKLGTFICNLNHRVNF